MEPYRLCRKSTVLESITALCISKYYRSNMCSQEKPSSKRALGLSVGNHCTASEHHANHTRYLYVCCNFYLNVVVTASLHNRKEALSSKSGRMTQNKMQSLTICPSGLTLNVKRHTLNQAIWLQEQWKCFWISILSHSLYKKTGDTPFYRLHRILNCSFIQDTNT